LEDLASPSLLLRRLPKQKKAPFLEEYHILFKKASSFPYFCRLHEIFFKNSPKKPKNSYASVL
jgi:hypothetical protein